MTLAQLTARLSHRAARLSPHASSTSPSPPAPPRAGKKEVPVSPRPLSRIG
jgi:hypothetical protein